MNLIFFATFFFLVMGSWSSKKVSEPSRAVVSSGAGVHIPASSLDAKLHEMPELEKNRVVFGDAARMYDIYFKPLVNESVIFLLLSLRFS